MVKRQGWTSTAPRIAQDPPQLGELRDRVGFFAGTRAKTERAAAQANRRERREYILAIIRDEAIWFESTMPRLTVGIWASGAAARAQVHAPGGVLRQAAAD
jgi:hypothetical protein